jgi:hypothetical protein
MPRIGTLTEKSLHAALKQRFTRAGDLLETELDGYVIDILRADLCLEIQTRNLGSLRPKLYTLLANGHRVHLIHPIAAEKWIIRQTATGAEIRRRRSPKRGSWGDAFRELVRIPEILPHPRFTLELLLTAQDETWRDDGQGSWRRKGWSLADRRLLDVHASRTFASPADYLAILPPDLPCPFTNRQLAAAIKCLPGLAGKITYTLEKAGWLEPAGKTGNAKLFCQKSAAHL